MAGRGNPYGDGLASDRIASILLQRPFAPFVPPA
jgi:UDP-N-acetylglucosamine 2-epimerase